jgi:hypothetical protein
MTLITLFSAPKPFDDPHIATIQRNAVGSWTRLPDTKVILMGNENGLAETARELGVEHRGGVGRNANGIPLISSMFELAYKTSDSPLLCIINTDMLLFSDFVEVARKSLSFKDQFVLLGRRWDLDITEPLDFSEGWASRLRSTAQAQGRLHRPAGSDYFIFPRSCYHAVPDFAIGRAGWDNWMIYNARREKWPVIDCTASIMTIHQNHDYSHLPGAKPHYDHPESEINTRLAGGQAVIRYSIVDATAQLVDDKLARPSLTRLRLLRSVELLLRRLFSFLPEDQIESVARPKRWKKRIQRRFK